MPSRKKQPMSVAAVAADVAVLTVKDEQLNVLLIKAKSSPFPEKWVIPGGLVRPDESIEDAVKRHLLAKIGMKDVYLEQLYTFGRVDRDPRGRVVSVAYFVLIPYGAFEPKTSEAYADIQWFPILKIPKLGYDHNEIAKAAFERLKAKLEYTNIVCNLLPKEFTLPELQKMYEIILDKKIDKRNFRKKILQTKLLKKSPKKTIGEAHRPAQVYSFAKRTPQFIEII